MILVTGATGTVGRALVPRLLEDGHEVRVLVRDPRKLGRLRVEVRLALGDLVELGDPRIRRQALRGVSTVVHLAAAIRDQPHAPVEELNGLATARLLRNAEAAGVERFLYFSALGASEFQRTRFFRAKALAERAVRDSPLETTVIAPSIVYDRDDPFVRLARRLSLLPVIPISGSGEAAFEPIWADDVARAVLGALAGDGRRRYELAGPDRLTYDQIARLVAATAGRRRPLVHVPLGLVRLGLVWLRRLVGETAFATWEEAELMEVPMVSAAGTADARALGVEPRRMVDVLAG
ncbi:MAG TPA: NAD(P)H-binding protein [Solirubrobacterales bacterium]|nr:NAD(P)H-binding protein [Solirubrobacterales bacterium]